VRASDLAHGGEVAEEVHRTVEVLRCLLRPSCSRERLGERKLGRRGLPLRPQRAESVRRSSEERERSLVLPSRESRNPFEPIGEARERQQVLALRQLSGAVDCVLCPLPVTCDGDHVAVRLESQSSALARVSVEQFREPLIGLVDRSPDGQRPREPRYCSGYLRPAGFLETVDLGQVAVRRT
jgi:hypothetical protein